MDYHQQRIEGVEEFLDTCARLLSTPRPWLRRKQIARLLTLAGSPKNYPRPSEVIRCGDDLYYELHFEIGHIYSLAKHRCDRLKEQYRELIDFRASNRIADNRPGHLGDLLRQTVMEERFNN